MSLWDGRRRLQLVFYIIISIATLATCLRFIYDLSVKDSYVIDASTREQQYRNGWRKHDDPDFIRYIKHQWLVDPPESAFIGEKTLGDFENISKKYDTSQIGQSLFVDKHLGKVENGFFVECGAADGKTFSNTFFFEKVRNWSGLLIEANPTLFRRMSLSGRTAYMINVCLSTTASSQEKKFLNSGLLGGLKKKYITGMCCLHVQNNTPQEIRSWGRFKNSYKTVNHRALKYSLLNRLHVQGWF